MKSSVSCRPMSLRVVRFSKIGHLDARDAAGELPADADDAVAAAGAEQRGGERDRGGAPARRTPRPGPRPSRGRAHCPATTMLSSRPGM